jgi:uncharacterized protein YecA (UPF0149 family)
VQTVRAGSAIEREPGSAQAGGKKAGSRDVAPSKLGRNDPCHCGSGQKYKKCCGA